MIRERHETIAGLHTFWREADQPARRAPTVYVHGVPTSSEDWLPFLERDGGIALDLPGFGRSAKRADFDYSIAGYRSFLAAFADTLGLERLSLVVHDWGAVGLALAQDRPEAVDRIVVMNAVPLLEGYRWHRIARIWRRRVLGELAMGSTTRFALRQLSREAWQGEGPMPDEFIDRTMCHFDQGTQRAILRLYRSAPPEALAAAGARLGDLRCPALVLWGKHDPYLPLRFAHDYARALGGEAEVEIADASHWPWIDRPDLVERVTGFLAGGAAD